MIIGDLFLNNQIAKLINMQIRTLLGILYKRWFTVRKREYVFSDLCGPLATKCVYVEAGEDNVLFVCGNKHRVLIV